MRRNTASWFCFWALLLCSNLRADYAWIAAYQKLQLRAGFDAFRTSDNYDNSGNLSATRLTGQPVALNDHFFWIEPELGVANDWAIGMRAAFVDGTVDSNPSTGAPLLTGSGLADLRFNLKWQISSFPLWTLETYFKFPNAPSRPATNADLIWGEGNFDVGVKAHYGLHADAFYFSASPGILGRFGGYASAATLDLAAQGFFQRAYVKTFVTSIFSFTAEALAPSTTASQSLAGTGGSYARLAASPTGIAAGATIGAQLTRGLRLEAGASRSIWGQRFPSYWNFTVNLLALFDFAKPDLRPKLRSVPFESVPSDL